MARLPIRLIENHDEAYFLWKDLGLSRRPLVHLDAHNDFRFDGLDPALRAFTKARSKTELVRRLSASPGHADRGTEGPPTDVGNYIAPAMCDGIIADFYWVIPGGRREFDRSLEKVRMFLGRFPGPGASAGAPASVDKGILRARAYGRSIVVTTLEDLPGGIDGALLDIDTDYLTTRTIRRALRTQDIGKRHPWIWPEELVAQLRKKRMDPSCVTVSYSVEGGYTPLLYKFLGDEVALFLTGVRGELREIIREKNRALGLFGDGQAPQAIALLENTLRALDAGKIQGRVRDRLSAHIAFALFRCRAEMGERRKARACYERAIAADRSYRVRDNNYGPLYLKKRGCLGKAEQEFRMILSVDKDNPHALLGMAQVLMRRKESRRARAVFRKAHAADRRNMEAVLGLCKAELLLKDYKAVLKHLERRKGDPRTRRASHALRAMAYEGLGMDSKALQEYKLAHGPGIDLSLCLRLLRLLRKAGVPREHREWIADTVARYRQYRKRFRESGQRAPRRGKPAAYPPGPVRTGKDRRERVERLIRRIDAVLQDSEIGMDRRAPALRAQAHAGRTRQAAAGRPVRT